MSIDITKPQIGRVYDYVLGGTFNYEADRKAAEAILEMVPAYPRWARLNRSFLGHVGRRWQAEGRRRVLDLGSGLPTQGHFNEHLPDAKILFSDNDPLSVIQGQQLLAYTPEMAYVEVDIRDADALLEQAASFFGDDRRIAVGCVGIVYFLSDDQVRTLMRRLHAFCAPGSVMALSFHDVPEGPESASIREALVASAKHARIDYYPRTPAQMAELLSPWRGFTSMALDAILGDVAPPPIQPDHPMHRARMIGAFVEH
jgi:hypothetical protein